MISLRSALRRSRKRTMSDPILASFSKVDIHRDYERFCSKRMDKCILWMWIFCFLQAIFNADLIFPSDSIVRRCFWAASNAGWMMTIILWVRYFIGSIRAHRRVMKGMDVTINKLVSKYTSLATSMPPQLASSSVSSSAQQQNVGGSAANGQI